MKPLSIFNNTNQLFLLGAGYFFFFATLGLIIPYLPLYLHHHKLDSFQIGVLISLAITARIIAPGVWAYWADLTGKRTQVVRLGAALALASFALLYLSVAFIPMLLAILLFNFFWNAILAQVEVLTLSFLGDRSHHYSKIRLWGSLGFIVNVTVGSWVIEQFGVNALLHLGSITLILLLLSVWWLKDSTSLLTSSKPLASKPMLSTQNSSNKAFSSKHFFLKLGASPLFAKNVWPFWLSVFLLQVSFGPYYTFFIIYMEDLGWSTQLAGVLISLGVIAEIILFMVSAKLLSRFSLRSLMLSAMLLTSVRWLALAWYASILPVLLISQLLHAASFALAHAAAMAFLNQQFTEQYKGRAQAIYASLGFGLGGAIGTLIAGYYWEQSPSLSYIIASLMAFLAAVLLLKLPKDGIMHFGLKNNIF